VLVAGVAGQIAGILGLADEVLPSAPGGDKSQQQ
jgi:hypothetical protein